jgi:PKD repeat protein
MKKNVFKLVLFATIGLFFVACEKEEVITPTASFSYEADELTVTFTDNSTNAASYAWDFGDSNTSTEKNPVHTYADYGTFNVVLLFWQLGHPN